VDRNTLYADRTLERVPDPRPPDTYFYSLFSRLPSGMDWLDRLLAVDVDSYLAWDILPKVDTATMALSLECRSPFLDHPFMEFAASLPGRYKLRGLTRKYLLKRYGRRWLPDGIVKRRKTGFNLPVSTWFQGDLGDQVAELLNSPEAYTAGLFRAGAVERLVAEHRAGSADRSYLLWALFVLEKWLRFHPAVV
jgi:asparagine synthase (glutamine-hydrolysing)